MKAFGRWPAKINFKIDYTGSKNTILKQTKNPVCQT